MKTTKIILQISPQTHVRTTQGDGIVFRIPEICPHNCDEYQETGLCKHSLYKQGRVRKKRIERYNEYKDSLFELAKLKNFDLPLVGAGIMFYIPTPKYWSKKKKKAHHMQWHHKYPDIDNFCKALLDGLMKQDKGVAYFSHLGKKWVDFPIGWIEITLPPQNIIEQ